VEATYFELMVAAALLAFRMTGVEIAVVEVGLGGRWDSTNATDPVVSVLTSVGLDHQAFLGDTREAIGREKLCIARDGRPLVLGPGLDPDWARTLLECGPELVAAPPLAADFLRWDHSIVAGSRVGLPGAHQLANLATALEALRQLRNLGFPVPHDAMWRGFANCRWPGRMWAVPGLDRVWMDGAHNPDGARMLAAHARYCKVRPHLVFGAMKDKDLRGMAAELLAMEPAGLTFVKGEGERYASAQQLREAFGMDAEALSLPRAAARLRDPHAGPWLVAGSLYLLGDLLRELGIAPYEA
jgi:dihydrofolate synthase/folylpolyglutamate synthase